MHLLFYISYYITFISGWSLGEHQEWSKYSNYEVSLKVPLIVHIPGLTTKDKRPFKHIPVLDFISMNNASFFEPSNISSSERDSQYASEELIELVDIFPTLAEIVNISVPPLCRLYPTPLCSEGISFYPVIKHHIEEPKADFAWKTGAFSQYPRPSENIQLNSDQPKLKDIEIMGYSVRTNRFRYTEWVLFNNTICKPKWHHVVAQELYDHKYDPFEVHNLYNAAVYNYTVKELSKKIKSGWRHSLPPHLFGIS